MTNEAKNKSNCRVDEIKILQDDSYSYQVSSNGEVSLSTPGVFTVFCSTEVKYFPYDVQTCYISKPT